MNGVFNTTNRKQTTNRGQTTPLFAGAAQAAKLVMLGGVAGGSNIDNYNTVTASQAPLLPPLTAEPIPSYVHQADHDGLTKLIDGLKPADFHGPHYDYISSAFVQSAVAIESIVEQISTLGESISAEIPLYIQTNLKFCIDKWSQSKSLRTGDSHSRFNLDREIKVVFKGAHRLITALEQVAVSKNDVQYDFIHKQIADIKTAMSWVLDPTVQPKTWSGWGNDGPTIYEKYQTWRTLINANERSIKKRAQDRYAATSKNGYVYVTALDENVKQLLCINKVQLQEVFDKIMRDTQRSHEQNRVTTEVFKRLCDEFDNNMNIVDLLKKLDAFEKTQQDEIATIDRQIAAETNLDKKAELKKLRLQQAETVYVISRFRYALPYIFSVDEKKLQVLTEDWPSELLKDYQNELDNYLVRPSPTQKASWTKCERITSWWYGKDTSRHSGVLDSVLLDNRFGVLTTLRKHKKLLGLGEEWKTTLCKRILDAERAERRGDSEQLARAINQIYGHVQSVYDGKLHLIDESIQSKTTQIEHLGSLPNPENPRALVRRARQIEQLNDEREKLRAKYATLQSTRAEVIGADPLFMSQVRVAIATLAQLDTSREEVACPGFEALSDTIRLSVPTQLDFSADINTMLTAGGPELTADQHHRQIYRFFRYHIQHSNMELTSSAKLNQTLAVAMRRLFQDKLPEFFLDDMLAKVEQFQFDQQDIFGCTPAIALKVCYTWCYKQYEIHEKYKNYKDYSPEKINQLLSDQVDRTYFVSSQPRLSPDEKNQHRQSLHSTLVAMACNAYDWGSHGNVFSKDAFKLSFQGAIDTYLEEYAQKLGRVAPAITAAQKQRNMKRLVTALLDMYSTADATDKQRIIDSVNADGTFVGPFPSCDIINLPHLRGDFSFDTLVKSEVDSSWLSGMPYDSYQDLWQLTSSNFSDSEKIETGFQQLQHIARQMVKVSCVESQSKRNLISALDDEIATLVAEPLKQNLLQFKRDQIGEQVTLAMELNQAIQKINEDKNRLPSLFTGEDHGCATNLQTRTKEVYDISRELLLSHIKQYFHSQTNYDNELAISECFIRISTDNSDLKLYQPSVDQAKQNIFDLLKAMNLTRYYKLLLQELDTIQPDRTQDFQDFHDSALPQAMEKAEKFMNCLYSKEYKDYQTVDNESGEKDKVSQSRSEYDENPTGFAMAALHNNESNNMHALAIDYIENHDRLSCGDIARKSAALVDALKPVKTFMGRISALSKHRSVRCEVNIKNGGNSILSEIVIVDRERHFISVAGVKRPLAMNDDVETALTELFKDYFSTPAAERKLGNFMEEEGDESIKEAFGKGLAAQVVKDLATGDVSAHVDRSLEPADQYQYPVTSCGR